MACLFNCSHEAGAETVAGTGLEDFGLGKLEIVLRGLAASARREQNLTGEIARSGKANRSF
jgi:hypothetical protein